LTRSDPTRGTATFLLHIVEILHFWFFAPLIPFHPCLDAATTDGIASDIDRFQFRRVENIRRDALDQVVVNVEMRDFGLAEGFEVELGYSIVAQIEEIDSFREVEQSGFQIGQEVVLQVQRENHFYPFEGEGVDVLEAVVPQSDVPQDHVASRVQMPEELEGESRQLFEVVVGHGDGLQGGAAKPVTLPFRDLVVVDEQIRHLEVVESAVPDCGNSVVVEVQRLELEVGEDSVGNFFQQVKAEMINSRRLAFAMTVHSTLSSSRFGTFDTIGRKV
jgi:hypothetical protein